MTLVAFLITLVLALMTLVLIFRPLFQQEASRSWTSPIDELDRLLQEREMLLTNLKDLQMDFEVNKISDTEYQALRSELMRKGSYIYAAIETLEQNDPLIQKMEADSHV